MKKLIIYLFIILSIFLIYKCTYKYKINYVALGDSLSNGRYPYGTNDYGFTDYVRDYLDKLNVLNNYNSEYATDGYRIIDIMNDISTNKSIDKSNIKKVLRESDLVTITIGGNDLIKNVSLNNLEAELDDINKLKQKVNTIINDLDVLLKEIKKYAKKDIILIGYYNPFPYLDTYKNSVDELVKYANKMYMEVANSNDIYYVDIFEIFDGKIEYLPNPFDIHPNNYGYKAIFNKIKTLLDINIIKKG